MCILRILSTQKVFQNEKLLITFSKISFPLCFSRPHPILGKNSPRSDRDFIGVKSRANRGYIEITSRAYDTKKAAPKDSLF